MAKYVVTYERDEDGWWIAHVQGVAGVNSDGRTVADARQRVREALSLAIGDREADGAELVDEVKLPGDLRKAVARATSARTKLEALQVEAQETTAAAVRDLRKRLGLSVRDIAELLGISHQRVQQLSRAR
jgi:predicted RNase H-like HicB family nuclease